MANEKVMVVETIEDIIDGGKVVGKYCSNSSGDSVKVKIGKGGHLKNKWDELQEGLAYSFAMGEYKGYPFVEDFTAVSEQLVDKTPSKLPKPMSRPIDETGKSIIRQVSWKTGGRLTEALIASGVFPKEKLTVPALLATQKKLADAGVEWIMSSHEVASKLQEEIDKQKGE